MVTLQPAGIFFDLETQRLKQDIDLLPFNATTFRQAVEQKGPLQLAPWMQSILRRHKGVASWKEWRQITKQLRSRMRTRTLKAFYYSDDHIIDAVWGNVPEEAAIIKGLRLAVGVTWDKTNRFRVWREEDAQSLVKELRRFPYVVGANLIGFDYTVLEHYVPHVRSDLGVKTIDLLAHTRWGQFVDRLTEEINYTAMVITGGKWPEIENEEWATFRDPLDNILNCYNLRLSNKMKLQPLSSSHSLSFFPVVSLKHLAKSTLGRSKSDKSKNAPALFAAGKWKDLVSYCRRDVALTRDIFKYGRRHGRVWVGKGYAGGVRVWWNKLLPQLGRERKTRECPELEPLCFSWQVKQIEEELASECIDLSFFMEIDWPSIAQHALESIEPAPRFNRQDFLSEEELALIE